MSNRITPACALLAGFIGGVMSHWLFVLTPVRAQAVQSAPEVRAQKFVLVDENGTVRGEFGFRSDGTPDLQITNGTGKASFWSNNVEAVRWSGVARQRSVLPGVGTTP